MHLAAHPPLPAGDDAPHRAADAAAHHRRLARRARAQPARRADGDVAAAPLRVLRARRDHREGGRLAKEGPPDITRDPLHPAPTLTLALAHQVHLCVHPANRGAATAAAELSKDKNVSGMLETDGVLPNRWGILPEHQYGVRSETTEFSPPAAQVAPPRLSPPSVSSRGGKGGGEGGRKSQTTYELVGAQKTSLLMLGAIGL